MSEPNANQPGEPSTGGGVERRRFIRHSCDLDVSCRVIAREMEPLWSAKLVDISAGGVGLVLTRRFDSETLLHIQVKNSKQSLLRTLQARVVHTRLHASGKWFTGCEFADLLGDEEILVMLTQASPAVRPA